MPSKMARASRKKASMPAALAGEERAELPRVGAPVARHVEAERPDAIGVVERQPLDLAGDTEPVEHRRDRPAGPRAGDIVHAGIEAEHALGPVVLDLAVPVVREAATTSCCSATTTLAPASASRAAAVRPPLPAPMTATSYAPSLCVPPIAGAGQSWASCRPSRRRSTARTSSFGPTTDVKPPRMPPITVGHRPSARTWASAKNRKMIAPYARDRPVDEHELGGVSDFGVLAARVFGRPGFAERRASKTEDAQADEGGGDCVVDRPGRSCEAGDTEQREEGQGGDLQRRRGPRPQAPPGRDGGKCKGESDGEARHAAPSGPRKRSVAAARGWRRRTSSWRSSIPEDDARSWRGDALIAVKGSGSARRGSGRRSRFTPS